MPGSPASGWSPVPIEFGLSDWREEVERYGSRSSARTQAQRARRTIEAGNARLDRERCWTLVGPLIDLRGPTSVGVGGQASTCCPSSVVAVRSAGSSLPT